MLKDGIDLSPDDLKPIFRGYYFTNRKSGQITTQLDLVMIRMANLIDERLGVEH